MDLHIIDLSNPLWMQTLETLPHDIYHLPGYVEIEALRTQTLAEAVLIQDQEAIFFVPYLLRRCEESRLNEWMTDCFDVISPYGYPGILLSEAALQTPGFADAAMQVWTQALRDRSVCSAFIRLHPILNQELSAIAHPDQFTPNGETISIDLTLSDAQLWNQTRSDHRNKINRCRRLGMTARMVPCAPHLQTFIDIYEETMERVGASAGYWEFNYDYFLQLNEKIAEYLHLCIVEVEGDIISAGLYSACCGIVQALFGGTRTAFLRDSPTTLETDAVRSWAKSQGYQFLHLGGGLGGSADRLYQFKAGFSKQRHPFSTLRLIINPYHYRELVNLRAKALDVEPDALFQTQFFPAYRAGV